MQFLRQSAISAHSEYYPLVLQILQITLVKCITYCHAGRPRGG